MPSVLEKYVPKEAIPLMAEWLKRYNLHLRISKSRKTKLGDFRPAHAGKGPRISVNGDLNSHHFLITFTHEVAHAAVWEEFGRRVNPHGPEWQKTYVSMLKEMMDQVQFPERLLKALDQHISKPKASSCSDPQLYRVLKSFDPKTDTVLVEELEEGSIFSIHGKRWFKKGSKRRSRYECLELKSKKIYLVSGLAEAQTNPEIQKEEAYNS